MVTIESGKDVDVYLCLNSKVLAETMPEAKKEAKMAWGKDSGSDLLYESVRWNLSEMYFDADTNSLQTSGNLFANGKELGYMGPSIPISPGIFLDMLQHYMDKLDKLKKVVGALK